ncbi:MAG TPA: hypothetical protein EYP21_02360 [Syntrophaceae bacterium]|nr:hypothetical protein [Syntrophaceae bacterium]
MRNINVIWTVLIGASLALAGCASTGKFPEPTKRPVEIESVAYRIEFPRPLVVLPHIQVDDQNDPKEIVEFALMLYEKGRFRNAGKFFLDAVALDESNSKDNRFRLACLSAAATCFLEDSDLENFHQVIERLKGEMDRFQAARMENKVNILIAISDKLKGERVDLNPDIPINVRDLFR